MASGLHSPWSMAGYSLVGPGKDVGLLTGLELNLRTACITAIALLACCLTSNAEDPASANREAIVHGLRALAVNAQRHYWTPGSEGGGGGSFSNLTLSQLLTRPATTYGAIVLSSPRPTSVTLTGTGREIGYNGSTPVEVEIIVYADSVSMTVTN